MMKFQKHRSWFSLFCFLWCVLFPLLPIAIAQDGFSLLERRKEQFPTEGSYLIFPLPYSLPGIGSGVVVTGLASNILETPTDIYGLVITGDAEGVVGAVEGLHLIPKTLIIKGQYQALRKAAVNNYEKRGMDTEKEDYTLIELNKVNNNSGSATLSFWDRRIELYFAKETQAVRITKIRNSNGDLIQEFEDPYESSSESTRLGFVLDYTDDRLDPRAGVRLEYFQQESPSTNESDPDFYVVGQNTSAYIPLGENSTWGFHYSTSDAVVRSEGETDREKIRQELGLNCPSGATECIETENGLVDTFYAQRKYGTSNSLGGQNLLRAYPQGRYQGAHTSYYGTEIRWNFSSEVTPFDFWIWKDVSTGFQLAFFYEAGSVADEKEDLHKIVRTSKGVGFRMLSASGFVYRADIATGEEGSNTTIIFSYPF